jgi:dolichyl-phosphate beta-glucosyltransferase
MATNSNAADQPKVSLIIPAYNEEKRLPESLEQAISFFADKPYSYEVICVVEKSEDNTAKIAAEVTKDHIEFSVLANTDHRGKGYAVKTGFKKAQGELVFFTDADLSTPLYEIDKFLQYFEDNKNIDVLIADREHQLTEIRKRQSRIRQEMGRTFNRIVKLFSLTKLKDTQCGFKAFRYNIAKKLISQQTIDGFAFDVELLMLAEKAGAQIQALPVAWINSPESKVKIWRDPIKMIWELIQIRWNLFRGLYLLLAFFWLSTTFAAHQEISPIKEDTAAPEVEEQTTEDAFKEEHENLDVSAPPDPKKSKAPPAAKAAYFHPHQRSISPRIGIVWGRQGRVQSR